MHDARDATSHESAPEWVLSTFDIHTGIECLAIDETPQQLI